MAVTYLEKQGLVNGDPKGGLDRIDVLGGACLNEGQ